MPIQVRCTCGKKYGLSDAFAGKTLKCSVCGQSIVVSGGGKGAPAGVGKVERASAVSISQGQITAMSVIGGLVILGLILYFGPIRVVHQWGAMEPEAAGHVRHLVVYSLTKKEQIDGEFDPINARRKPAVESNDVAFSGPVMALVMPQKVSFYGKSTKGAFSGTYDTHTGEVDADVSYGGYAIVGPVDLKKPKGTFHLVGRVVDGQPQIEIDGKKI